MVKTVEIKNKEDFVRKLLNLTNSQNLTNFSKAEISVLLELYLGTKNRLNNKYKLNALKSLEAKNVISDNKINPFIIDLFDKIDDGNVEYTIKYKL